MLFGSQGGRTQNVSAAINAGRLPMSGWPSLKSSHAAARAIGAIASRIIRNTAGLAGNSRISGAKRRYSNGKWLSKTSRYGMSP